MIAYCGFTHANSSVRATRRNLRDLCLRCILYRVCRADFGAMAQLVAHLHGMERVRGSNPLSSTDRVSGDFRKPFFHAKTAEFQRFQGIWRKQRMYGNVRHCQHFRYPQRYPSWVPICDTGIMRTKFGSVVARADRGTFRAKYTYHGEIITKTFKDQLSAQAWLNGERSRVEADKAGVTKLE